MCTGTAFIRLVGILLFRGKFQILAAKGKRSSFGSRVTVHAETVTDDERDLSDACEVCLPSTCSPSVRKPYVCQ